jgi:hypothetical protein
MHVPPHFEHRGVFRVFCPAILALIAFVIMWANETAVWAAESRYSTWGSDSGALESLVDRLNRLIDEAEQARAADPRFLRDLREALRGYDRPWRVELLHDDFRDGEFANNPSWTLAEGQFTVDFGVGLRSVVQPESPPRAAKKEEDAGDLAAAILGSLLRKGDGGGAGSSTKASRAEIFVRIPITNAFAVQFDVFSREAAGRLKLDIYQGDSRGSGYRIAYNPSATPGLELIRFGSRGASVVETSGEVLGLEDGLKHRIEWTRHGTGTMLLSVDGREQIRVTDRSFKEPFDGLSIANEGGDYSIREITILGTQ